MAFFPDWIETPQEMRTRTGDQRDLVFLSGYAAFRYRVDAPEAVDRVVSEDIYIPVGPVWSRISPDDVVASVALATIEVQKYYDIGYHMPQLARNRQGEMPHPHQWVGGNPFPINLL